MELERLIACARRTHELLSASIHLDLFDDILQEADESLNLYQQDGRILTHTIRLISLEIIPNFSFNAVTNRFIRSPLTFTPGMELPAFPKTQLIYLYGSKGLTIAFASYFRLYQGFIGECHLEALYNLIGNTGMVLIAMEITKNMLMLIDQALVPTMDSILNAVNPVTLSGVNAGGMFLMDNSSYLRAADEQIPPIDRSRRFQEPDIAVFPRNWKHSCLCQASRGANAFTTFPEYFIFGGDYQYG